MLYSSRVVTLKVAPVDPRDIFRGDYVILSYGISRLELEKVAGDDTFASGDEWNAVAITKAKPHVVQGGTPIRGTVDFVESADNARPAAVRVSYGIESYFVPEGTGRAIEEERQKGDLSADIAIDTQGRAAIKAMRRKGQLFYVEGVF
jgi:uncharacterized membrane-anchored protein